MTDTTAENQERTLTEGEKRLATSVFGPGLDLEPVRMRRRKWFPFQARDVVMAPLGHIHFHPKSIFWTEDFSQASLIRQGLFIHEMTHVWQHQKGIYLPLARHPFCRYDYRLRPGWRFADYGIEQQAEIVKHAFLLREGYDHPKVDKPLSAYTAILPFRMTGPAD